jgi:hypothetical protein
MRDFSGGYMVAARNVREWFAFHGGEELGISLEHASIVWEAATDAMDKSRTSTNKRRNAICRWKFDVETCSYDTSCGEKWCFPEGSAVENGLRYCPICGKRASVR